MKLSVQSPYSGQILQEFDLDDQPSVEQKILIAQSWYRNHPLGLEREVRIQVLQKFKTLLETNRDELISTAIAEGGKPFLDTQVEMNRAIKGVELAIDFLNQDKPIIVPMDLTEATSNREAYTTPEPIGVVVAISAFNHPINLIIHQVVTAFAAGCPVIVKPDLRTPISCVKLVDLLYQSGAPQACIQVSLCDNSLAEKIATDLRINYVSFIGSARVGWHLRSLLAPGTRCALEHGGLAPAIILEDVTIDEIIPDLLKGAFYHAGQVCVSTQRLFIPEILADEFIFKFKSAAEKLHVGDPSKPETQVGPIINSHELKRIKSWVDEAVSEGAQVICGGNILMNTCFEPTVILNPSDSSKVSKHELFGPVLAIYTYTNLDEAIQRANQTVYHFQAAVFSQSVERAKKVAEKLNASAIMINDHTAFRVDWMPFGGRGQSGLGLGGIQYSIEDMTVRKLVVIKH